MTDPTPKDLSNLVFEEFIALSPQGEHAPGPKPLSPAAQEVLDAVRFEVNAECFAPWIAVAALRALADQVVPHEKAPVLMSGPDLERLAQRQHTRAHILAIAGELEAQP